MVKWKLVGAAVAALATAASYSAVMAEGLAKLGPKIVIAHGSTKDVGRISSRPLPLAPNTFIVPFTGQSKESSPDRSVAQVQQITGAFVRQGTPATILSGLDNSCCANFAESGGAKLGSGFTQVVWPIFTYDTQYEVFGFPVQPDGSVSGLGTRLTRSKQGHQSAPVVIPLKGGTAFAMWADYFHETGESETSVRGAMISDTGNPTGDDLLIENSNVGYQIPADGTQLADGTILLVWKHLLPPDSGPRARFYGRIMRKNGKFSGQPFLLANTDTNFFQAEMRVAALPNGNFVAVWIDAPFRGAALSYYRLFSPTGAPLGDARLVGNNKRVTGVRLDVTALADSRFVITGTLIDVDSHFVAQLMSPDGDKIGKPLVLETFLDFNGALEHHAANVGYLLGVPPGPGGLMTAPDATRIYVTWRVDRDHLGYVLYGQALRTSP